MSFLNDNSTGEYAKVDYDISPENIKKPPSWPLIAQGILILFSVLLFILSPHAQYLLLSVIGYLLTPFATFALLAIQRSRDLKDRSSAFYDHALGKTYLRLSGTLSLFSFLLTMPIVWRLATEISQL